jgi:hypothetical protein
MKKTLICSFLVSFLLGGLHIATAARAAANAQKSQASAEQNVPREIYGKIESVKGTMLTLRTRSGDLVQVETKPAQDAYHSAPLVVGRAVSVKGTADKAGVIHAEVVLRAKDSSAMWPPDR